MHHKSAKNHVKIHSLVYSAEEALAETRVQKPKCCFNVSETTTIQYNTYIWYNIHIFCVYSVVVTDHWPMNPHFNHI